MDHPWPWMECHGISVRVPHTERPTFLFIRSTWATNIQNMPETSEPRPKQNRRPEPQKHTKDPHLAILVFWIFFRHCETLHQRVLSSIYWYFETECMFINPKRSHFYIFRHYATISERKKNTNPIFSKNFRFVSRWEKAVSESHQAWMAPFGCLETVFWAFHKYFLGIFQKLCAFWALDKAPT